SSYLKTYADDVCVIIQIETPQAVGNIAAYGEVAGIDAMLIRDNDLAANMGNLGDTRHPDVPAAGGSARRDTMPTGKAAGFPFFDDRVPERLAQGFSLAAVAGAVHTLPSSMAADIARLRP